MVDSPALRASRVLAHSAHGGRFPRCDDRLVVDAERGLFIVANGTGPSYGGYHAPFALDPGLEAFVDGYSSRPADTPRARLSAAFQSAHAAMRQLSASFDRALAGGRGLEAHQRAADAVRPAAWRDIEGHCHFAGAVTAVCLAGDTAVFGQIGDCRAYVAVDGVIALPVADHSLGSVLAASGQAPVGDVHRSVVTRLLGFTENAEPDYAERRRLSGASVLLCSPGVWNRDGGDAIVEALFHASGDELIACLERCAETADAAAIRFSID